MELTPQHIEELLRQVHEEQDNQARHTLLSVYAPLIKSVSARFLVKGVPLEKIEPIGHLGLTSAIDLYKPDEHYIGFATYAHHMIAGHILHALRGEPSS